MATAGVMLVGASTAAAAGTQTTTVPQGIDAASLPGAVVFGNTPPNTPEQVSFIMREQNLGQLEASVELGTQPALSVGQFAERYGAPDGTIWRLRRYLGRFGITTKVYADQVDVSAQGTAGEFDQALDVTQHQYNVPAQGPTGGRSGAPAQTVHGTGENPRLPDDFGRDVLAILGLTNYAAFTSNAVHVDSSITQATAGTSSSSCSVPGLPNACHLPQDFANGYNLSPLYDDGANGQGETIGIVTLAALDPGAPQYFWNNVAHLANTDGRTVTVDNIDGGPGAPSDASGTGETDLDVEQSGGVAPGANVIVYQAPNTDAGFADAFFDAASQNLADTVSASWGESETVVAAEVASGVETPAYEAAYDEAFLEFAAQGQSGFLSSGDAGAYDASEDLGTTNLSVDTSADSPYITSSGGTTLPGSQTFTGTTGISATVKIPAQRIWGWDYLWAPVAKITPESLTDAAETDVVGSGGGFSAFEPKPSYQRGVTGTGWFSAVPYLTPTDYGNVDGITEPQKWSFDPTPPVIHGNGSGRAEPDVSTDADPDTGYLLYEPSFAGVSEPVLEGGWGGTSFVAPQLNGSTAVIDSYVHHRVGFWNPGMYAAAQSSQSPLTPLNAQGTDNDNIYYTGTPGTLYNPGAGLGTPNLAQLGTDLGAASR